MQEQKVVGVRYCWKPIGFWLPARWQLERCGYESDDQTIEQIKGLLRGGLSVMRTFSTTE